MTTPALANPFDFGFADVVMPSAENAAAPLTPLPSGAAAARFDRYFDPVAFMNYITIGFPETMADDDPPLFITDPSPDFIAAFHRDVLPTLEQLARRGG